MSHICEVRGMFGGRMGSKSWLESPVFTDVHGKKTRPSMFFCLATMLPICTHTQKNQSQAKFKSSYLNTRWRRGNQRQKSTQYNQLSHPLERNEFMLQSCWSSIRIAHSHLEKMEKPEKTNQAPMLYVLLIHPNPYPHIKIRT